MSDELEPSFVESQRQRLQALRSQLQESVTRAIADSQAIRGAASGTSQDSGDDAQRLAVEELDENVIDRSTSRLEQIEHALKKVAAGTYGVSDVSGRPIPMARLKAVPEATRDTDE